VSAYLLKMIVIHYRHIHNYPNGYAGIALVFDIHRIVIIDEGK